MGKVRTFRQAEEWRLEDHAPRIEMLASVRKGDLVRVRATIGEENPHPHKKEHHIGWIAIFFRPDGEKFPYPLGRTEFSCTEEAETDDPQIDSVATTLHEVCLNFKAEKSGILFASSSCTLHGEWQSSKELKVLD